MSEMYDLLVLGAGSGGVRLSRMAAAKGLKVAVIEERYLGGTCVNVGCVPKKLFVYGAQYAQSVNEAKGYGVNLELKSLDWATLRDNKTREINRLNGIYNNLLEGPGVKIIHGRGKLVDANSIEVEGQIYQGKRLVIATGGWPFKPDIDGAQYGFTSNEAFYLENLPKRVVVVGGVTLPWNLRVFSMAWAVKRICFTEESKFYAASMPTCAVLPASKSPAMACTCVRKVR